MPKTIIFCSDPIDPKVADAAFQREADAATALGVSHLLIDHEALDHRHDTKAALRRLRVDGPIEAIYRGWMLRVEDYALLYDALEAKEVRLVNSPDQYAACHWGPVAYPHVAPWMAPTAWIAGDEMDDDQALAYTLAAFGDGPVVLKDWVKSQAAGYWEEACFIPSASDLAGAKRVISRFRELQGNSLVGGLVFRAWRELAHIGDEVMEWRVFAFDGHPVGCWPRITGMIGDGPPKEIVEAVCAALPSHFATADFARLASGGWLLLEVGDGQVSGLPEVADPQHLLNAILGVSPLR
ncbi:hypothetical protein D3874_12255 [Oleomonas cavernae]|uniref:ATP-grasp domain-containing protein n=1 Tax=Oleomonas cavernae TaxID=2320859 RepID=A0A418WCP1_9PROT|nr:ATP-grasp domain-containing protein [Oleomonas cavernae]RJF87698.1 hypothetical protein D3874_12255 [Oleomonas cavernae]